ncbi:hypothetical protein O181_024151 [Austropuccinia psidii MF-1]|uniref:Uncharacterized protein n=1 Tax=Austropuccinia psidii MF-1 TaxID=1389203 RepID=A0A9Q3GYC2_9BASI|nr:hypothetical protein [Austropuccinia psidii MF-1]
MLFKIVLLAFVVVSAATAPSTPKHQMVARTDGGYGGSSGYGYKQQSSFQETESYKLIKKKYEHLSSSIDDCHHALTSKTVSEQVAIEQVKKVAYSFKSAFGGHLGCGACSYHMRAYKSDIQSSFRKFSSLVSTVQQLFPDKWDSILHAGLYEAASTFRSFFERVQMTSGINVVIQAAIFGLTTSDTRDKDIAFFSTLVPHFLEKYPRSHNGRKYSVNCK